jgi:hypothetical protein
MINQDAPVAHRFRDRIGPGFRVDTEARRVVSHRAEFPPVLDGEGMGGMSLTTRTFARCSLLLAAVLPVLPGAGCESMSNTDKGVLAGGGLGAAAGALVGGQRGRAGPGALIGGALGAVAGGLTGSAIDNSERKQAARVAAAEAARRPPLALEEIVQLTRAGSTDEVIINQIRLSGSVYTLTGQEILYLQNNGVRDPVIREMQATPYRAPRAVYTAVPVQPVYVVEPPPPPVGVGVGFSVAGGRRW